MSEIDHILSEMEPFIRSYGVVTVFVILTFESIGFPLPGESLLVVAFALARRGEISFSGLLFFARLGGVLGDNIGYFRGKWLGRSVVLQYGQKVGLNAERLGKIETVFQRYGLITVTFARFFNVLRQLNGVVAGTLNMNWWMFLVCNALGCAIWVLTWALIGSFLVEHMSDIKRLADRLGLVGVGVVILGLMIAIILHKARAHRSN